MALPLPRLAIWGAIFRRRTTGAVLNLRLLYALPTVPLLYTTMFWTLESKTAVFLTLGYAESLPNRAGGRALLGPALGPGPVPGTRWGADLPFSAPPGAVVVGNGPSLLPKLPHLPPFLTARASRSEPVAVVITSATITCSTPHSPLLVFIPQPPLRPAPTLTTTIINLSPTPPLKHPLFFFLLSILVNNGILPRQSPFRLIATRDQIDFCVVHVRDSGVCTTPTPSNRQASSDTRHRFIRLCSICPIFSRLASGRSLCLKRCTSPTISSCAFLSERKRQETETSYRRARANAESAKFHLVDFSPRPVQCTVDPTLIQQQQQQQNQPAVRGRHVSTPNEYSIPYRQLPTVYLLPCIPTSDPSRCSGSANRQGICQGTQGLVRPSRRSHQAVFASPAAAKVSADIQADTALSSAPAPSHCP